MAHVRALYLTSDSITAQSGGGQVVRNEVEALADSFDEVVVLAREQLIPPQYQGHDIPALADYFALFKVRQDEAGGGRFNHCQVYSGCFSQTIAHLKARGTVVTFTSPAHDRLESIAEWERLVGPYPFHHISDPYLWGVFSEGLRLADRVIAPSRHSATFLAREGVAPERIVVIPHGYNPPDQTKLPLPFPDEFRVGYLGAFGSDKGVLYLVRAWGALALPDATLVLAGRDSQTLEGMIRREANGGKFALLGYVPDVSAFYRDITVYCQPSVTESMGLEVLEAMGHGRPVIASTGAGASEVLDWPGTGAIYPPRDATELRGALTWFYRHWRDRPDDIVAMGNRAAITASGYTWAATRARYRELFAKLHE